MNVKVKPDASGKLLESIVNGIREKKGHSIATVDLRQIDDTVCRYFVICQADTANQLLAIEDSIRETVRVETGEKPFMVEGTRFAHWIAMDYGDIMVHLFVPELRKFYDLEHLWADAVITDLPDLDL
ncbi:MAG: ribosome silencing factor [Bacteroidaceae bacterium]|nr:ribosome silencing factor [Bacteroidaceae bacterium]